MTPPPSPIRKKPRLSDLFSTFKSLIDVDLVSEGYQVTPPSTLVMKSVKEGKILHWSEKEMGGAAVIPNTPFTVDIGDVNGLKNVIASGRDVTLLLGDDYHPDWPGEDLSRKWLRDREIERQTKEVLMGDDYL